MAPNNGIVRVFLIKDDKDTSKSALQLGDLPDALVALRLGQVLEESEFAPVAQVVLVLPQAVGANTLRWDHTHAIAAEPVCGQTSVKVPVVEGLQRQPASWDLLRVSELGTGGNQEVTDVHILILALVLLHALGCQLSLAVLF